MIYSVCVAAYKRPKGLQKLLDSLVAQQLPREAKVEIIVVDNDPDASAGPICERMACPDAMTLTHLRQPEKNISLTRNVAVSAAHGEYLCFIDDDERAATNWLQELVATLEAHEADAAFGRIVSEFPRGTPTWVQEQAIFKRPLPPAGAPARATPTSNCIVRADVIRRHDGPFPEAYGTTGGEDSFVFKRMMRDGGKLVSAPSAVVYETIPPERTQLRWILQRAYRGGNTFTRVVLELKGKDTKRQLAYAGRALVFMLASCVLAVVTIPRPRIAVHWLCKIAANAGHIAALRGSLHHEYR